MVWGYSDLNSRVKQLEGAVAVRRVEIDAVAIKTSLDGKSMSDQLSSLKSDLAKMSNDIEWIKRNIK